MRLGGKKTEPMKAGKLRRGQLITTFGCGSIVDLPKESVIVAGTDYWKYFDDDQYRVNEDNLQQYLGVDYFVCPPPILDEMGRPTGYGIPAFRFPTWMYCPKCGRLAPARTFGFEGHPRCKNCKKNLVPSRFVVACENGHLDDFPYHWWVHGGECKGLRKSELFISMSEKSSGLESIIITCRSCNKSKSMAGSFGMTVKCTRRRPWLNDLDKTVCDKPMRTMQRGATNLHFNITTGALSIPPWSEQIQIELGKRWNTIKCYVHDETIFKVAVPPLGLLERCKCTIDELWRQALMKEKNENSSSGKTWQEILEGEYRAFLTGSSDEKGEFKTRSVAVPAIFEDYIEQVVLALRLREVVALRGFKRLDPEYDIDDPMSFTSLSRDEKKWLPGIELLGEGIFIRLNQEKLAEWEKRPAVKARYNRWEGSNHYLMVRGPGFSPRYILLHSLSHHLIRQLTLQCGYASATIKERIYCTFIDQENALDMAGILFYTATNDSEGSLGGLVREGKLDRLDNILRQMLESASWCSADPLCIQSTGQGLDALNLAACHSCTLLPETSCEKRNCFLDRASLTGTLDDSSIGFFSSLLK